MNTDQQRADFEAWHEQCYGKKPLRQINSSIYAFPKHQNRWEAYQAGRAALQSQDREDAERYRDIRQAASSDNTRFVDALAEYGRDNFASFRCPTADEFDAAIDHARRVEGADDA